MTLEISEKDIDFYLKLLQNRVIKDLASIAIENFFLPNLRRTYSSFHNS